MSGFHPGLDLRATREPMGFAYGQGVFGPEPERRSLDAIRRSLRDPGCSGPDPVYAIAMDVGRVEHREELQRRQLLFGVVTYAAGRLGEEPVRSQGHVHRVAGHSGWSPPELYEVWGGRAIVLMQEHAADDPGRCFAIEAAPGEVVVVPPGWAHATVSADPLEPMTFGAWCDREYGFEYDAVRARGGLAYFPLLRAGARETATGLDVSPAAVPISVEPARSAPEVHTAPQAGRAHPTSRLAIAWQANPRYSRRPLAIRRARAYPELNLRAGEPIYRTFARDPEAVQWVSDPARAAHLWPEFEP